MRYIILGKKISDEEIISRKRYIEKTTKLYYYCKKFVGGVELISMPSTAIDCLLLVGHDKSVEKFLSNYHIEESAIAVVSCACNINLDKLKGKEVYVSFKPNGFTNYYDGKDRGLDFNISNEELLLINSIGNFIGRIKKYFRRIK